MTLESKRQQFEEEKLIIDPFSCLKPGVWPVQLFSASFWPVSCGPACGGTWRSWFELDSESGNRGVLGAGWWRLLLRDIFPDVCDGGNDVRILECVTGVSGTFHLKDPRINFRFNFHPDACGSAEMYRLWPTRLALICIGICGVKFG